MAFYENFTDDMLECSVVLTSNDMIIDVNPSYNKKIEYIEIYGDGITHMVEHPLDIDSIRDNEYDLEIRMNNPENTLIYSTIDNDSIEDFLKYSPTGTLTHKEIHEVADEMSYVSIVINRPFIHTKDECVLLHDITLKFEVEIVDDIICQTKIEEITILYHKHNWLPNIVNNKLGVVGDITKKDIPLNILHCLRDIKPHLYDKIAFSVLWLYRYYTGDIYIINVEPKGNNNKSNKAQYYVVAHLHIMNNMCGNCTSECISNWSDAEIDSLDTFLINNNKNFQVVWYQNSSIITYKNSPFIIQSDDCCFVDKTAIDFNLY